MAFEIVHPAVVHFPVALLMTAAPVAILGAITRKPTWQRVATVCLVVGAASSFMAVETGEEMEEADYVASKALIHEHEEWAERTMYSAIALALLAVGVEVVTARSMGPKMLGTGGRWAVAAGSVAVAGMVGYTGHLGAQDVWPELIGPNAIGTTPEAGAVKGEGGEKDDH
jgi:uncharacterized membrane protein